MFLFGANTVYEQFAYGVIIPLSLALGAIAVILVGDGAIRLNRWDCHMLFAAGIGGLAMAVHDTLIINNIIESTNGLKSTIVMIIFLPAISIIFLVRLTGSFARAERLATSLDQRLSERNHLIRSERSRIMRDIHDGLGGQLMSIVALSRSDMTDRTEIEGSARRALHELRLMIWELDFDGDLSQLLATFREHAENQLRIAGIALDWRLSGRPGDWPISPEQAMQMLRILQEAITNAAHHSGADRVAIEFSVQFDAGSQIAADGPGTEVWLLAVVADNGRGFESGSGPGGERRNGNGVANMRARAERLGGVLDIKSDVAGTIVQLRMPLAVLSQDGEKAVRLIDKWPA